MEKENNTNGTKGLVLLLAIIIVVLSGYLVYDKVIKKDNTNLNEDTTSKNDSVNEKNNTQNKYMYDSSKRKNTQVLNDAHFPGVSSSIYIYADDMDEANSGEVRLIIGNTREDMPAYLEQVRNDNPNGVKLFDNVLYGFEVGTGQSDGGMVYAFIKNDGSLSVFKYGQFLYTGKVVTYDNVGNLKNIVNMGYTLGSNSIGTFVVDKDGNEINITDILFNLK